MTDESMKAGGAAERSMIQIVGVPVATVATLLLNYLAQALPIGNGDQRQISDQYPTLITPAAYVFSIWGFIYLGVAAYAVFQALPAQRTSARLQAMSWWYIGSAALNMIWIVLWQFQILPATIVFMLGILGTMIKINLVLRPSRNTSTWAEYLTTDLPFEIYLSWICIATIANFSTVLWAAGWTGSSEVPATIVMMVIASGLAVAALFVNSVCPGFAFATVTIWAYIGIYVKQQNGAQAVAYAALVLAALIAVAIAVAAVRAAKARGTEPAKATTTAAADPAAPAAETA